MPRHELWLSLSLHLLRKPTELSGFRGFPYCQRGLKENGILTSWRTPFFLSKLPLSWRCGASCISQAAIDFIPREACGSCDGTGGISKKKLKQAKDYPHHYSLSLESAVMHEVTWPHPLVSCAALSIHWQYAGSSASSSGIVRPRYFPPDEQLGLVKILGFICSTGV